MALHCTEHFIFIPSLSQYDKSNVEGDIKHQIIITVFDLITAHTSISCTVKQFRNLQNTASVLFVYFPIKTNVVSTHKNCIDLSMQFKLVPTTYVFIKKNAKKSPKALHKHHLISHLLILFLKHTFSRWIDILQQVFPEILKNLSAQCGYWAKDGMSIYI